MSERIICTEIDEAYKVEIDLDNFIPDNLVHVDRFLRIVVKHDESILEKLLEKYKKDLIAMDITTEPSDIVKQYNYDYSKNELLLKYPESITLMENAYLHFLNFQKYESKFNFGEKLEILHTDNIRGVQYVLYYLAYALLEFLPRDIVYKLAIEWTDQLYDIYQDQIIKHEDLDSMFKGHRGKGCWKTHNLVSEMINGRYYLKVTRCIWADIYSELPDLKLASLLECYGDFSKMQYINPNFALSRTKTLVEGHCCCDFVHYDKRIEKEIEHPNEEFWKEFK